MPHDRNKRLSLQQISTKVDFQSLTRNIAGSVD